MSAGTKLSPSSTIHQAFAERVIIVLGLSVRETSRLQPVCEMEAYFQRGAHHTNDVGGTTSEMLVC